MTRAEAVEIDEVRDDPKRWFQGFGWFRDEETRQARRGPANVLQRRYCEAVRLAQKEGKPCRLVGLKYRRAGSSTISSANLHVGAMNHEWRIGVIGTDYKASSNMLSMVRFFAEHDDFPGWRAQVTPAGERTVSGEEWCAGEVLEKTIATRLEYAHGSVVELYTSKNPESARSAGLNAYLATEVGRWAMGGVQDGGETLTAMRNALPKKGFHLAIEESTANGAQGVFYETCRSARWPRDEHGEIAAWARQWETVWPLEEVEFGRELQFVFIFAAWFEDERHVPAEPLTPAQEKRIEETLDERERALIERYGQEGPRGKRLGGEVAATVWEQLAWRRAIIATVCTKGGADEFDVEYPCDPRTAFKSSGSPALDPDGVLALEAMCTLEPEWGQLSEQRSQAPGKVSFDRCGKEQATVAVWEEPFEGGHYLLVIDCMSGAEQVTGTGVKDRHAGLVLRRAYIDQHQVFHRTRVVARIKAPCEWEEKVLLRQAWLLSRYYGGATIVPEVEGGCGTALAMDLLELGANLYQREEFDSVTQRTTRKLGWRTTTATRPIAIGNLQHYVREQMLEAHCPHLAGELGSLVVNAKGKAEASSGAHDDDAMALAIGLTCIDQANEYPRARPVRRTPSDARAWRLVG